MITTIEELKKASICFEAVLPPFPNGIPFTAKLKKPSIFDMTSEGKIANPLLLSALGVVGENTQQKTELSPEESTKMLQFVRNVAESCLVEPTLQQINEYAGGLSDNQIFAIYQTVIADIQAYEKFC